MATGEFMKFRVSNSGGTIEGKRLYLFGDGVGALDIEARGGRYLAILLTQKDKLTQLIKSENWNPKVYFFNKIIYVEVEGDEFHYILNLNRDTTHLTEQIMRDKMVVFAIMTEDEQAIDCADQQDIIIE
jgi:hypothetical protein